MVRDRTVVIGHLIGLLRALSVLISFSFHLFEQKKILGLTQRQRCFFSRNITLQCIFSKYLLSNNRKRVNVIWLSCALSGWDINVCLIDQLLRCNVGQCHVWQKGGMPISAICTCVSIIGPHLHHFPLCISFVPDADVGQCQLHLWWKCQAGL